jgi:ribosomal protein S18 acetylase RimI-like enzyme
MSVEVRPAIVADVPALLDLYAQLSEGFGDGPELSVAEGEAIFRGIAAQPDRTLLTATVDGAIAGTVDLLVVRPSLTHHGRPWAAVENVVVGRDFRRHGVGRALMEEAAQRAREAGCHRLQLLSRVQRTEAQAFYRAIGMEASAQGFRLNFDDRSDSSPQDAP